MNNTGNRREASYEEVLNIIESNLMLLYLGKQSLILISFLFVYLQKVFYT